MGVRSKLDQELNLLPGKLRTSALAEMARTMADEMDAGPGARDLAALNKELRATLTELETRAGQVPTEADPIDGAQDRGPAPIPIRSRRSG